MNKVILIIASTLFLFGCTPVTPPSNNQLLVTPTTGPADQAGQSVSQNSRYQNYSPAAFAAASQRRVLFFHAAWCPTCKAANQAFNANLNQIPEDVVIFKTDYDTQNELKRKYGITYQHTFVQVDANGNQVAKWNGGDIDELTNNLK